MIDNYTIKNIHHNNLCICYLIDDIDKIIKVEESLLSQLSNTNIKDFSVLLFTNSSLYDIVNDKFKSLVGRNNIIKVNPLFLNNLFILVHPKIQEYKVCISYNKPVIILNKFDYNILVNQHIKFPLVFLVNSFKDNFSNKFNNIYINPNQNTLGLSLSNIKQLVFDCYCSRINKENKLKEFLVNKVTPNTDVISLSYRITKSPILYEYIKNLSYNGINCSDVPTQIFSDAKGYKIDLLSSTGLKLKLN